MSRHYQRIFKVDLPYIGYGCASELNKIDLDCKRIPKSENGYYMVMSRVTPHNLTDVIVDGFIKSGSKSKLLIAGHLPKTKFYYKLLERSKNRNVTFLGLVEDQAELNQLLLNCRAYLHGHSLGGINSALVRAVGLEKPVICVDTVFNREVVEAPNGMLQAVVFEKNDESVAQAIKNFEGNEAKYLSNSIELGAKVRQLMSWNAIYDRYVQLYKSCLG